MKKTKNSKPVFVCMAMLLIFALPIIIATYLNNHRTNFNYKTTNYGHFAELDYDNSFLDVDNSESKWLLSYFHPGACDKECVFNLTKLESIYLATGKNKEKVKSVLITSDASVKEFPNIKDLTISKASTKDIIALFNANKITTGAQGAFFILDPQTRYVMYYSSEAQGNGILRDLRHLLKVDNA